MLLVALVVLLAAAAGGVWLVRTLRADLGALRANTADQLAERSAQSDRRIGELTASVDRRLEGIDGRILATQQSAGQTATQIVEKLGKLDGTAAQMLARANDLAKLEQALRPPKARGGFGELLLENLLRDRLPANAFAAYLQLIVLGMRSMQVEERAHEVMAYVAGLGGDFMRFKDEFDLVGKHLGHAQTSYTKADKRLGKFESKLDRAIEDDDAVELAPEPRAIEAA